MSCLWWVDSAFPETALRSRIRLFAFGYDSALSDTILRSWIQLCAFGYKGGEEQGEKGLRGRSRRRKPHSPLGERMGTGRERRQCESIGSVIGTETDWQ